MLKNIGKNAGTKELNKKKNITPWKSGSMYIWYADARPIYTPKVMQLITADSQTKMRADLYISGSSYSLDKILLITLPLLVVNPVWIATAFAS